MVCCGKGCYDCPYEEIVELDLDIDLESEQ